VKIRITCRAPVRPTTWGSCSFSVLPSFLDTAIIGVEDDGTEHRITNVSAVSFRVAAGEEATATLEFFDVEADIETQLVIAAKARP